MSITLDVTRYVTLKRGLGYQFLCQARTLAKFAAFADLQGDKHVLTSRVIEWASSTTNARQSQDRLVVARHFAIFMHAEDDCNEIPPRDVFGRRKRGRPRPRILATKDIELIMAAALKVPPVASITPFTMHYVIGLLATTGLRVSEAIALMPADITADGLIIRETKFHKTRLVPIHDNTRKALAKYLKLRQNIGGPDPHIFVLSTGQPPDRTAVSRAFMKLAKAVGVRDEQTRRTPRLHDLRHSFAVRSLENCNSDPATVKRHMLALSTYLGHACLTDTYWYLETTPVLALQISEATETARKAALL